MAEKLLEMQIKTLPEISSSRKVSVRLPNEDFDEISSLIETGEYKNLTNFLIDACHLLLGKERALDYDNLHNKNFERVIDNSLNYLSKSFSFDLIVQDSDHHKEHVRKEIELILNNNQLTNYYFWGHDY